MPADTGELVEAMHAYIDAGGDTDTLLDMARMVAAEREDDGLFRDDEEEA